MVEQLSIPSRWGIVFSGSMLLWIVPISMKAPRLVVLASFVTSIGGFAHAAQLAAGWKDTARVERRTANLNEELEAYRFALEEESIKQQMVLQYFPEAISNQSEPETVAHQTLSLPQAKSNPAIESFINWLCNRAVPKASVREVQQAKIPALKGFKSTDIHDLFAQAVEQGYGIAQDGVFYHKSMLVG